LILFRRHRQLYELTEFPIEGELSSSSF